MSTIVTINAGDQITNSRADLNTNFANLNSDKIETSYLDTDTTLSNNSDVKIATQKAVKAYVDTGGNANASETVRGIVEEATDAEVTAGTATGATGAKLFVTPAKLATRLSAQTYLSVFKTGYTTKNIADANATQNIAHGLGKTPIFVRIDGFQTTNSVINKIVSTYDGTTQFSISVAHGNGTSTDNAVLEQATFRFFDFSTESFGTITVDSTNIKIAWVKNGSAAGTVYLIWEAIA